jgi:hypothetical protein
MSRPCLFYDQSQTCACAVLQRAGSGLLPDGVMERLVDRYCAHHFASCPIFLRVKRKRERLGMPKQVDSYPRVPCTNSE